MADFLPIDGRTELTGKPFFFCPDETPADPPLPGATDKLFTFSTLAFELLTSSYDGNDISSNLICSAICKDEDPKDDAFSVNGKWGSTIERTVRATENMRLGSYNES